MGENERGKAIGARREALGMTAVELARRSGVDRGRIKVIEEGGNARVATMGALEKALDEFDAETSGPYDSGDRGLVTFRLKGNFGVDVTVQGPVDDLPALEASVSRLLSKMESLNGEQ